MQIPLGGLLSLLLVVLLELCPFYLGNLPGLDWLLFWASWGSGGASADRIECLGGLPGCFFVT